MLYDLDNPLQAEQFKLRVNKLYKEKKIVSLSEKKKQRTLNQNAYLHVILGYFASETGNTLEYVKENYFKKLCNKDIFVVSCDDRFLGKVEVLRSSASLTTEEMTTAINRFRNWASSEAFIYLPEPSEEYLLSLAEIETEKYKDYL